MIKKFAAVAAAGLCIAMSVTPFPKSYGQSLPDSMKSKVDGLFRKWDKPNSPGCVVGIIRNDSLLYAKGYGLANLEDSIPNTPESIYYMCSLSKQFTGYAIVLLARQGKLKLDDDIHLYLPWMADFGHKVTIRNLLNHTSGIRDEADMADIMGLPPSGILTQAFALDLLKRQQSLNFVPGEKHSYSNSNYVLLAEIVKVVSGQSFPAFVDDQIFKPLGMDNSRFVDDAHALIKGRAASYSSGKNSLKTVYVLGAGGLFTNMNDMARWVMNYYLPKAGDAKDITQLTERGRLNDGEEINYALGISVDSSKGWKRFSHFGSMAGYLTVIYVYPDLHMGFLVFGNSGDHDTYHKIDELESLFVPDIRSSKPVQSVVPTDSVAAILSDSGSVRTFLGNYISENGNNMIFTIRNGRLWVNGRNLMMYESGTTYRLFGNPALTFRFFIDAKGDTSVDFTRPGSSHPQQLVKRIKGLLLPDAEMNTYTGTYYAPELDFYCHIVLRDHQLWYTNNLHNDEKIILIGRDDLFSGDDFIYHVKVVRENGKDITGFELDSDENMHLKFNKIK